MDVKTNGSGLMEHYPANVTTWENSFIVVEKYDGHMKWKSQNH